MSIFVTCLLVVFDAFIQHLFSVNLIGYKFNDTANRLSGFFGEELILGSYLSRLALILNTTFLFIKIMESGAILKFFYFQPYYSYLAI